MPSAHDSNQHRAPLVGRLEAVTTVAVLGAVGLILGLAALVMPSTKATTAHIGYKQSGTFSYRGNAPAGSVYGSAGLITGQPIQAGVVKQVNVRFGYRLTSAKPIASFRGTATLVVTVSAAQGISRSFPVAPPQHFRGPAATITGTLPLAAIQRYVNASHQALDSGLVATQATVTLAPQVHVNGTVAGRPVNTTYAPTLPFVLNGSTLTQAEPSGSTTAVGSSARSLTPSSAAATAYPTTTSQHVNLLLVHPSVTQTREAGFGLALLCLLIGLGLARPLLRRDGEANERDRIRALYGSLLVPVDRFDAPPTPVADVASIGALADLAKRYESMIMHRRIGDGDEYTVWDNGLIYRYRSAVTAETVIDLTRAPVPTLASFSAAGVRRNGQVPASRLPG